MMGNILGRLTEPSTWAGIAALLEALKFAMPAYAGLLVGAQTVAGGVAVMLRERGAK